MASIAQKSGTSLLYTRATTVRYDESHLELRSLQQQIHDRLLARVLRGELGPGERLRVAPQRVASEMKAAEGGEDRGRGLLSVIHGVVLESMPQRGLY